ncbi:hypothetical protein TrispH2_007001 [Trichoplax sp. H2]|nr:hypothetical protein TrispH2_007001 [Trichoplax sp. H2]|eukprot:RDD41865.1 hypothetical protein TrispH2_007001 [Trichoplax sp. H2]
MIEIFSYFFFLLVESPGHPTFVGNVGRPTVAIEEWAILAILLRNQTIPAFASSPVRFYAIRLVYEHQPNNNDDLPEPSQILDCQPTVSTPTHLDMTFIMASDSHHESAND